MATARDDPHLGAGPSDDDEVSLDDSNEFDSESVLSDDSVLPDYERQLGPWGTASTLYEACSQNEIVSLRRILARGVTKEEVMELDINGRNGLMLAVSRGYIDIVYALNTCPLVDINHQDNDGNTALMIAAQAGFANTLNYILNYYPGVDTEVRDPRGFTALIKASMQGREECVAALLMNGANMNAVDLNRGKGIKEWALKTGRFDVLNRLRRLSMHPVAEQFCETYPPEWPELKELVAKTTASKSATQKVTQRLKDSFTFSFPHDPQDNGVLDHMVRITTSLHSPLVATGCRPLCPTSPPEVGKRRLAVPELMARHTVKELEESSVCHSNGSITANSPLPVSAGSGSLTACCSNSEDKEGLISNATSNVKNFLPRSLAHRNSVFPSGCIPTIQVTRSGEPTPKKEKKKKNHKGYLEPPIWKYKEAKEEKKKEKEKLENAGKGKKDKAAKKKAK